MKYIFLLALLGLIASCHEPTQEAGTIPHTYSPDPHAGSDNEAHDPDEIVITSDKALAIGIKTEKVQPRDFHAVIRCGGSLQTVQDEEVVVVAPVSGIVSFERSLTEGMNLSRGESLLLITGRNIENGDAVSRVRIAYETAEKEYERAAKLVSDKIISQKEFEQISRTYQDAKLAYEALSPAQDGSGAVVQSPKPGFVKACLVKEGEYVTAGKPLLVITGADRLRLRAEVSERNYRLLKDVVSANFSVPVDTCLYRLDRMNGRVISYGRTVGDSSFYIPVIFEFDNNGQLLSGSYVDVFLQSAMKHRVLTLPVSAFTEEQGVFFVYVKTGADTYHKRPVVTGNSDGAHTEILSGLQAGEDVVTKGVVHVKLASVHSVIPAHTHEH